VASLAPPDCFAVARRKLEFAASVQSALFDDYIFADDQAVRGHFAKFRQNTADVLIVVDKNDHNGKLAAGLNQVGRMHFVPAQESGYGVKSHGSGYMLFA
jgi:hypothetical protein